MPEIIPPVFSLGILITLGFLLGILAEKVNLPRIVAYILVGAVFSPDLLGGVVNLQVKEWAPNVTDVALGIIAFLVGAEINFTSLKGQKSTILSAVAGQSIGALLFVALGLWGSGQIFNFFPQLSIFEALVLGAISTATAPAASLGIIEEYKAEGKTTNALLGVIAIDDAISIILFTFFLGLMGEGSFGERLMTGGEEILGALIIGGALGYALGFLGKKIKTEELRLAMIIGFIFLAFGISKSYHFSMLLCCMTLGFVSKSFKDVKQAEWLVPLEHIEELVFLFFFTLAGVHFKFNVLITTFGFVLVYILLRIAGKYMGAYTGMTISNTDKETRKLLGLCLFPQAGVAIGLAIQAVNEIQMGETGTILINVILGSTIIFELVSPLVTRYALRKSGNIEQWQDGDKSRKQSRKLR
ncbi:MAG: cation:proton antiporter [Candidatus Cyclobacteriaceae bacterium M2_1C_046]